MNYMFEVYYRSPSDSAREERITHEAKCLGGKLSYREEGDTEGDSSAICLTYEFPDRAMAEEAADKLRQLGEYVENLQEY